jgi:hypothetical protein
MGPIFLAYLVPLDVDVTGNITAKLSEVWSEFNIFCSLVTIATAAILNFFNPPKAATHYGGYSYKVMETAKIQKIEKHKNDHSRLLAKQKLMKLDRKNIHI